MSKGSRNKKGRDFEEHILEGLRMAYNVKYKQRFGRYTVITKEHGVIDIYPKADKVLIRDDSKWLKNGLEWVCNNL